MSDYKKFTLKVEDSSGEEKSPFSLIEVSYLENSDGMLHSEHRPALIITSLEHKYFYQYFFLQGIMARNGDLPSFIFNEGENVPKKMRDETIIYSNGILNVSKDKIEANFLYSLFKSQSFLSYSSFIKNIDRLINSYYHRENGPAYLSQKSGVQIICYYLDGKLHREGGPAFFSQEEKGIETKKWYKEGKLHGYDDKPAITMKGEFSRYFSEIKEWYHEGIRHRSSGPAKMMLECSSGIWHEDFYLEGKLIEKK